MWPEITEIAPKWEWKYYASSLVEYEFSIWIKDFLCLKYFSFLLIPEVLATPEKKNQSQGIKVIIELEFDLFYFYYLREF